MYDVSFFTSCTVLFAASKWQKKNNTITIMHNTEEYV